MRYVELALFAAPLLALLMWRSAAARGQVGPPPRQLLLMFGAVVALGCGLFVFAVRERLPPGRYVPARVVDGRIVPGHAE